MVGSRSAVHAVFAVFIAVAQRPETFAAIVAIALLAVVPDLVWKRVRRPLPPSGHATPNADGAAGHMTGRS